MDNQEVEGILIAHAVQSGLPRFEDYMMLQGIEKVPTFKLQAPGIYFLYGITMSGKTTALKKIIQYLPQILEFRVPSSEKESNEWVLVPEIKKIDYFYGGTAWQKNPFDFLESMGVQFHSNGLPTQEYLDQVEKDEKPRLIILDDLMQEIHGSKFMVEVFTKAVHHSRLCVFMTQQTLHPHSKHSITLRSQATGSFYFRFSSEDRALRESFRKFETNPNILKELLEYYKSNIAKPGGYLYVDGHPRQPFTLTPYLSHIFPDEGLTECLVFRKNDATRI